MKTPESNLTIPRRGMLTALVAGIASIGLLARRERAQAEPAIPEVETYKTTEEAVGQDAMEEFEDVEAKFASAGIRTKILLWNGAIPYPETQRSKDTKNLRYMNEELVSQVPGDIQLADDALVVWISNIKDPAKHNMKPQEIFQVDAGIRLNGLLYKDGFDTEMAPFVYHLWNRKDFYRNTEDGLNQSHTVEVLQKIWNFSEQKRQALPLSGQALPPSVQAPAPPLDTVKFSELVETPAPAFMRHVVEQPRNIDPPFVQALATAIAVPWVAVDTIRSSPILSAATVLGTYELMARRWFPQMRLQRAGEVLRALVGELVQKKASPKGRQPMMVFESKDPNAIYERQFFGPMWVRTQQIFDDGIAEVGEKIDHFVEAHRQTQLLNQATLDRSISRQIIAAAAFPSVLGVLAILKLRADQMIRSGTKAFRSVIPSAAESDAFVSDLQEKLVSMFIPVMLTPVPAAATVEKPSIFISRAKMLELQKQTTKLRRNFVARAKRIDEARDEGRLKAIVPDDREVAWTQSIFDGTKAIDKARAALWVGDLNAFHNHLNYAQMIHNNLNAESYLHQQKISRPEIARLDAEQEAYRIHQEKIHAQNEAMAKLLEEHGVRQSALVERAGKVAAKLLSTPNFNGFDQALAQKLFDLDVVVSAAKESTVQENMLGLADSGLKQAEALLVQIEQERQALLNRVNTSRSASASFQTTLQKQADRVRYPGGVVYGFLNAPELETDAAAGFGLCIALTHYQEIVGSLDVHEKKRSELLTTIDEVRKNVSQASQIARTLAQSSNVMLAKFGGEKKWIVETLMRGVEVARLVETTILAKLSPGEDAAPDSLVDSAYVAVPRPALSTHSNGYDYSRTNGHASILDTKYLVLRERAPRADVFHS
ncbi:MAG: hypothetical protein Q8R11_00030 [bacterium]|nr:hypothetical protein [bacterium]